MQVTSTHPNSDLSEKPVTLQLTGHHPEGGSRIP